MLERLSLGWGVGAVTDYLVANYEITRRSANLDIQWASNQLLKSLADVETAHMAAWLLSSIQRVAQKSEEAQQYGLTLGCYKLLLRNSFKRQNDSNREKHVEKSSEYMTVAMRLN